MAERYVATFDSESPERGIVLDEVGARFARFPSVAKAAETADKLNHPELPGMPRLADVLVWRSTDTGNRLDLWHLPAGSEPHDSGREDER